MGGNSPGDEPIAFDEFIEYSAAAAQQGQRGQGDAMKFGIFYEHQLPRPWGEGAELQLFQDALDQVELADRLGIDFAWEVEHHFLEEYSHSSCPEVFLAACSQRTKNIRLGHGIMLLPAPYNHPARAAERIATLDLVSRGRVEFGTGESSSLAELGGFQVPLDLKRDMWLESIEQTANMLAMDPYPGFKGEYFEMPCRNVLPKPVQRPHPPLWVACSNRETIHLAAKLGIGALTFAFVDPEEAKHWVDDYYTTLKNECIPIGHAINPNIAMVTSFSCHEDEEEARRRGLDGFRFFGYGLGHHYGFGIHKPGRTNIWESFEAARDGDVLPARGEGGIGTPDQLRAHLRKFADVGVDQVVFIQQGGRNKHEHICESLELFASKVMPEFKQGEAERERAKLDELAPYLEQAMARKKFMPAPSDDEIPDIVALGRQIAEGGEAAKGEFADRWRERMAQRQAQLDK
jgi:alkanesulfonate monooxygenase SsuD/methylene tetrahydromethanopterin reductase-like flavin-dependent oxidoreductase (luciferase family)